MIFLYIFDVNIPALQRYKIIVEYDGTDFIGWQMQPNGRSVQEVLERAAEQLFQRFTRVIGAGRTDAGVHGLGQVAHFDASSELDTHTICRALNAHLPADITVHCVEAENAGFHARFSASSRAYEYTVTGERTSLHRRNRWLLHGRIDHGRILDAVRILPGTHDFTTFSKQSDDVGHCYCHIFEAEWTNKGPIGRFTIRANRFLHGMVRAIVGGLVQVGRHRIDPDGFAEFLIARDRALTPMLAPPHGLVLTEVRYDPEEFEEMRKVMTECRKNIRVQR